MSTQTKQYELLAAREARINKVTKCWASIMELFKNKLSFCKIIGVYKPVKEGEVEVKEQDTQMYTTVPKQLALFWKEGFIDKLDVCHQINVTNCSAQADVVLYGTTIFKDVPVTTLMEVSKFLIIEWKPLLEAVPTLDSTKGFELDGSAGENIYKAIERVNSREQTEFYGLILSPATDKHPAQVSKENRRVITGYKHEQEWSGMLTPARKSQLLSNCEDLVIALKVAASRANDIDASKATIGQAIYDVLMK